MTAPALRAALALAAAILLAGCATPPPSTSELTSGRIALRIEAEGDAQPRQWSASFELRGTADAGELSLASPLGTTLGQARWTPTAAVLVTSDGERRFDDLDALAREALGEAVPLRALPDWLAGRPWPGAAHAMQPPGFTQLGWTVDLARHAEGWLVATRHEPPPVVTVRVRLEPRS